MDHFSCLTAVTFDDNGETKGLVRANTTQADCYQTSFVSMSAAIASTTLSEN
ncbi:MAG: hypothetical protein ACKVH8_18710 [Pirellulales bacterium]